MEVGLIFILVVLFTSTSLETNTKVNAKISPTSSNDPLKKYVYNVDLSLAPGHPSAFIIKLLSSVLGSEKAAKKAYLWFYDDGSDIFAAYLTREQAKRIAELHDVASVTEQEGYFPPVHDLRKTNFAPQESES